MADRRKSNVASRSRQDQLLPPISRGLIDAIFSRSRSIADEARGSKGRSLNLRLHEPGKLPDCSALRARCIRRVANRSTQCALPSRGTASLLRLGLQVALRDRQVNRNQNVLVRDQPLAFDLAVAVAYAQVRSSLLPWASGVGTHDALDIVAVGEAAPDFDTQVAHLHRRIVLLVGIPNPCTGAAGSRRTRQDQGC